MNALIEVKIEWFDALSGRGFSYGILHKTSIIVHRMLHDFALRAGDTLIKLLVAVKEVPLTGRFHMMGNKFILWRVDLRQISRGLMHTLAMAMAWHSLKHGPVVITRMTGMTGVMKSRVKEMFGRHSKIFV